jgi:hypothetical protein
MLVTFMDEHWKGGAKSVEAAIAGAGERLRPILMTACAMTVGMLPMALALERGSQMQAPLGRAVIGGLVMSTFATLLVVPSIFAVVIGRRAYVSPSIYPDDRESQFYDPNVFAKMVDKGDRDYQGKPSPQEVVQRHTVDELLGFLRSILHEVQSKRHDMVTHHNVDDLLDTLGFLKHDDAGEGGSPGKRADGPQPRSSGTADGPGAGHSGDAESSGPSNDSPPEENP